VNGQNPNLDPNQFEIHRDEVRPGVELAWIREGVGGIPLLLLHGFPETKRIWWRNIEPLVESGFEVIVPDLRGYGDSPMPADGFSDTAAYSRDLGALVTGVLGHHSITAAGGDLGGVVMYDIGLRFEGLIRTQCFFNSVPPALGSEAYAAAGLSDALEMNPASIDYFFRQGFGADRLAAELDTSERRVEYISDFYGHRLWSGPDGFDGESRAFHAEPFGDATTFRTSIATYESALRSKPSSEASRFREPNPITTLVLYAPEDHVTPTSFPQRCAVAFPNCIGPFTVPGAGHFLQWERAALFNRALAAFLR
jgi:pimeloyl-ACP methyl ester carboxylesterase